MIELVFFNECGLGILVHGENLFGVLDDRSGALEGLVEVGEAGVELDLQFG